MINNHLKLYLYLFFLIYLLNITYLVNTQNHLNDHQILNKTNNSYLKLLIFYPHYILFNF